MMIRRNGSQLILGICSAILLASCGGTTLVSTPTQNIDAIPLKVADLTEEQEKNWGHTDLLTDTIPGMSVDRAYKEIIGNKKGKKVIVAVLDSGIDLEHEDLDDVIWTNKDEIPGNGKDDDKNGYIDDVHGYNFLGESYHEQLEMSRMLKKKLGSAVDRAAAQKAFDKSRNEYLQNKQQLDQIFQLITEVHADLKAHFGKEDYTKEEVSKIKPADEKMQRNVAVATQILSNEESIPKVLGLIEGDIERINEGLNYNYNLDFNGREVVGDDPYDITDTNYGNGNPQARSMDESHGTHVAGIIAAERNNGKGANGVANNVAIMSVRCVPNGDEYDKDVALGIRYAVDNGAKIINCSFGKSFSPNAEWVYDAIKYAASKDVLIVHAAGNDGNDLDDSNNPNFFDDHVNGIEIADNVITVGALTSKYGSSMVAGFSNYGTKNVDVFAPGAQIYSTFPENTYETIGGTSMAAPGVAGIAALIRSQYPSLKAAQVKQIIMDSGLSSMTAVVLSGDNSKTRKFDAISKSGKMANAYNALILAQDVAKGKIKLKKVAR